MFSVVLFPPAPGDAPSLLLAVVQTTRLPMLYLCLSVNPCSLTDPDRGEEGLWGTYSSHHRNRVHAASEQPGLHSWEPTSDAAS